MCFWVVLERWKNFHFFGNFSSRPQKSRWLVGKNPIFGGSGNTDRKKIYCISSVARPKNWAKKRFLWFFPQFFGLFSGSPESRQWWCVWIFACKLFSRRRPSRRARASGGLKSGSEATCGAEHKVGRHTLCIVRRYAVHTDIQTYKQTDIQTHIPAAGDCIVFTLPQRYIIDKALWKPSQALWEHFEAFWSIFEIPLFFWSKRTNNCMGCITGFWRFLTSKNWKMPS